MRITVAEALKLEALRNASLVAGEAGKDRIIKSVNIMEVPQIGRFIKRDELLVTTTYPIKNDKEAQRDLIPTLVMHGVAALAIKPVFYGDEVPQFMLDQANSAGFPIICLPRDASFNEILNPILGEILNRQARILQRNEDIHQRFTNIVLGGGSICEIANLLASLQMAPVSIYTSFFKLAAFSPPPDSHTHSDHLVAAVSHLAANQDDLLPLVQGKSGHLRLTYQDLPLNMYVHPVSVGGETYANIIVWLQEPERYEINVIEQTATIVALEYAKLRAVAEVERRFRGNFIEELIAGKISSRAEVLSRGEQYGWDLSPGFIPLLIEMEYCGKSLQRPAQVLSNLRHAVYSSISIYASGSVVVDIGTRILVLILPKDSSPASVRKLVSILAKELKTSLKGRGITLSLGAGRFISDIMSLGDSYGQAVSALEIGKLTNVSGDITFFDDLGAYRVLLSQFQNPELSRFSEELLGELAEHVELLETLEVVLDHNGNVKEASRDMYLHYNTLRYRVAKIQELTGVDLCSGAGQMNLRLALMIRKLNSKHF